jgi:ATP-dependent Clp protease ATP-binding subunit ClpA
VVAPVLAESGITLEPLRALVAALDPGPRRRSPFSRAAKRALEQSLREAQALGDRFIGAEHVLLGLLADERAGSLALVRELGADPEKLRAAVLARRAAG